MTATASDVERYREYLQEEVDGIYIYRTLADIEEDPDLKDLYERLILNEQRHLDLWTSEITKAGGAIPEARPTFRARALMRVARTFGSDMVLPIIKNFESGAESMYRGDAVAEAAGLVEDEGAHARVFGILGSGAGAGGVKGSVIGRVETRHRALGGGNALRAAVLGANDGLVSNLALVAGVAGANPGNSTVILAGVAGLLAGAASMALGEWISVTTSLEATRAQIEVEREEIRLMPEAEAEEMALIYQARGMPRAEAEALAQSIIANPEHALATMSREELGVVPEELGSAMTAAVTSFVLFALGAAMPVLPFLFLQGVPALVGSAALSSVGLFVLGGGMTLLTGRNPWYAGTRQFLLGLAAATVTYVVGGLVGGVAGI
ncbi:MAG: VIT1/CCC1 transporter family protein [Dehalococcoidia bacterium]|nr:VIT1/CCC1 transporter family protein [Dehalococcoidia bacterium]